MLYQFNQSIHEIKTVDVLPLPISQLFSNAVEENTEASVTELRGGVIWQKTLNRNCLEKQPKLIAFAEWVAPYNVMPTCMLAKVIMGGVLKVNQTDKLVCFGQKQEISEICCQFNPEQQIARSGKTEGYSSAIAKLVETIDCAQILILMPEIVLTSQLVNRVRGQVSKNLVEWHSRLTPKTRHSNWLNIASGNAQIIIEHDSPFKQEQGLLYNTRDMAIILAKFENIPIILSSATPLLGTIHHVKSENYNQLKLTKRFGGAELPLIKVVDMRSNKQWISDNLFESIKQTIEKK
ncbi:replication restart protein PriA-like [Calliopsis andreniformis]|uniref:replication restart protein PriA-like n=1 Tax=Calliopsis andreniformis TaxID=337506 RepID=UPI003FCE5E5F